MKKKIWVVEIPTYGKIKTKTFYTESGFNKFCKGSRDIKVSIFELIEETNTSDINDNAKAEYKQNKREERLGKLLDGDGDTTYADIDQVCELITKYYKDNNKTIYSNYGLNQCLSYRNDPKQFKRIISSNPRHRENNRNTLLNKICKSVEDYEKVLKIHNFRPSTIDKDDTERLESFNKAKQNIK